MPKKLCNVLPIKFVSFATTAKFVSEGAKPLLGEPVAGELEGAYFGLAYTYNLDLSTNFENQFFVFSKSGRFFKGLPDGDSVVNLDFEKAIELYPNRAGNYKLRRGKILLEFATGKTDSEVLKDRKNQTAASTFSQHPFLLMARRSTVFSRTFITQDLRLDRKSLAVLPGRKLTPLLVLEDTRQPSLAARSAISKVADSVLHRECRQSKAAMKFAMESCC